jgi:hypothetical protein
MKKLLFCGMLLAAMALAPVVVCRNAHAASYRDHFLSTQDTAKSPLQKEKQANQPSKKPVVHYGKRAPRRKTGPAKPPYRGNKPWNTASHVR